MNPKGRINNLRRKTTRFFSKIFVSDKLSEDNFSQNITQVKKVLVSRPNHRLGNNLLLTPLITEISEIFPNAEIHIFTKGGLADVVFENYKDVIAAGGDILVAGSQVFQSENPIEIINTMYSK